MTSTPTSPALADCGCCAGVEVAVPASEANPPGLSALAYRVGTYATFLETMIARLGTVTVEVPSPAGSGTDILRPLLALTTREPSDPTIALLDAWAVVADVLSFYQERNANEGYLPTALEPRSLMELARLVDYRPRPGVAASVRLAFTVAAGFEGVLPAGTRAQSMPAGGGAPQFYETSADLAARAAWNTLPPRLTRPQLVTPAATSDSASQGGILVTGADVVDSLYLDGIATQIKPGDGVFFIFGSDTTPGATPAMQVLRVAAGVDAQADFKRTQVTLGLQVDATRTAIQQVQLYADKGTQLFPGNDIAAQVVKILGVVAANLANVGWLDANGNPLTARQVVAPAMSRIAIQRDIAVERGFTRVTAWLEMLIRSLQWIGLGAKSQLLSSVAFVPAGGGEFSTPDDGPPTLGSLSALPAGSDASPLSALSSLVGRLAAAPSLQPANPLRLARSVAASFGPQADTAPRLLATLHPAAAPKLYKAWSSVGIPGVRVEVYAARVKVTLFASNWPGVATSSVGASVTTSYTSPHITTAWPALVASDRFAPSELPLDGVYDAVKPGSWVAIQRPANEAGTLAAATTFHVVSSTRTAALSVGTSGGFVAKSTLLTLDPPWLSDLNQDGQRLAVASEAVLRQTLVYAQAELQAMAEEPVDADVERSAIDLAQLVEGLEAGRWIIVSGTRTDIPGASGVATSELAMVAGVRQGVEAPGSVACPLTAPPFLEVSYVTDANAYGDRLVVGRIPQDASSNHEFPASLEGVAPPAFINQQFADQVQIAPGYFANAYVPTQAERFGNFPAFDGLLVDPLTQVPYAGGELPWRDGVFAWRVTTQSPHTVLDLAAPLAYTYDRGSVAIYGNVADATHGQSTGEVLGDGDATASFASFPLSQSPLTWVSAATPSGVASTLQVRVNEMLWHERGDLSGAAAGERVFVTSEDDAQSTTVTFGNGEHGARPPTGTANIKAAYRYGIGSAGNTDAWLISQLTTRPLGAQAVTNPLPATGGADPDRPDQVRSNAPMAVMALDRLVSVQDYADFSRTFAGIGKATAAKLSDGRSFVHVTVAGADDIPIGLTSDLYANLLRSLQDYGDPFLEVRLATRRLRLLVIAAVVAVAPDYAWEDVEPRVRAALFARFAFDARDLGQSAYLSEAVATAQAVPGVAWLQVTHFDGVAQDVDAARLASLAGSLGLNPHVQARLAQPDPANPGSVLAAELVILTPGIPAMLTLTPLAS